MGGLTAKLLSFYRTTRGSAKLSAGKIDPGAGANRTGDVVCPANEDAVPLPGDYTAALEVQGTGRVVLVGFVNTQDTQKAQAGEKRIYARDAGGAEVVELWLKSDGSATLSNGAGYLTLEASGEVIINGATITTGGDVITAAGISLDGHTHPQANDSGGNTEQPTGAPQ